LGKKHYPLGSGILSSGKAALYPQGKEHGYPLVGGTLSSGEGNWYPRVKAQVGTEKSPKVCMQTFQNINKTKKRAQTI